MYNRRQHELRHLAQNWAFSHFTDFKRRKYSFSSPISSMHSRWSVTSLRGPGERNFNAVSHKPTRAPIQFNSICSRHLWFMGYGIKISFPRPPQWRHRSPGCYAVVLATFTKQLTPQLWMEGSGEGCGFFCSPKLPHLSTMSQQVCRRL